MSYLHIKEPYICISIDSFNISSILVDSFNTGYYTKAKPVRTIEEVSIITSSDSKIVKYFEDQMMNSYSDNSYKKVMYLDDKNILLQGAFIKEYNHTMDNKIQFTIVCDVYSIFSDGNDPEWLLYKRRNEVIEDLLKEK